LRVSRADVALQNRDFETARQVLEPLASSQGGGARGEGWLLYYAEALAGLEREGEALALLPSALPEGTPQEQAARSPLVAKRAELLLRLGRDTEAEQVLAPFVASSEVRRLSDAGRVYQRAGRFEQAIAIWERAMKLDPDFREAPYFLSVALEQVGQHERSLEVLKSLVQAQPDFAQALNNLGYAWAQKGENLEQAVVLLQRAVSLEPANGDFIDSLGWAHFRLGQLGEARGHLERAARLRPDEPTILEHLGDVYAALGEVELASGIYRRALNLKPGNADQLKEKLERLAPPARR
jgi:tetratricopeptide (TPR) repeat protein